MMDNSAEFNLFGGWSGISDNPDFPFGAKTESYPIQDTSIFNVKAEPQLINTLDQFLGENFNPFEDVMLPKECLFDADELLRDFNEDVLPVNLQQSVAKPEISEHEYQPILYHNPPEIVPVKTPNYEKKSKLLINLKTFKVPSKSVKKPKEYHIVGKQDIPLSPRSHSIQKKTFQRSPKAENVTSVTLKDAVEMGFGDEMMDKLLKLIKPVAPKECSEKLVEEVVNFVSGDSTYGSDSEVGFSESEISLSESDSSFFSPVYSPPSCSSFNINMDVASPSSISENEFDEKPSGSKSKAGKGRRPKLTQTEKKMKKMEQNKKAATRYRQKKKEEENVFKDQLDKEEERHKQLVEKYKDLRQEIKVMKKIMKDVFIAKGLVSASAFK